jgi:hypothetical protein
MDKSTIFTIAAIIAIAALGLYARYAVFDAKILHDYPVAINAGDPNARMSEAEWVKISGSARNLPPWTTGETDLLLHQPPMHLVLAALMSGASHSEIYDMLYFNAVIAGIGAALCYFVLFSRILKNRLAGLIAAAMLVYPFEQFFSYHIGVGMFATFSTIFFYPIILLFVYDAIQQPSWKNILLLYGAFALQFLMHSSEALVLGAAIGSYLLIFERKKIDWKKYLLGALFFLVLTFPFWPTMSMNYASGSSKLLQEKELVPPSHEPQIFMTNVLSPILLVLALLGIFAGWKKRELRIFPYILIFYFAIIFLLAKFGIGTYYITIRFRPLFYIIAYPVAVLGLIILANSLEKIAKVKRDVLLGIAVISIIALQVYLASAIQPQQGSLFTKEIYNGFVWVREHTPKDAKVLCIGCTQLEGGRTQRVTAEAVYWEPDSLKLMLAVASRQNTTLHVYPYTATYSDERIASKNIFNYYKRGSLPDQWTSICDYDFIAVRAAAQEIMPTFQQIIQNLVDKNATIAYNNAGMTVIKNSKKGGECI